MDTTDKKLALAWVYNRPGVTSTILGPRTIAQLTDVLDVPDLELDDELLAELDRLAPPGRVIVPQYGYDGMAWVTWGPHQTPWENA